MSLERDLTISMKNRFSSLMLGTSSALVLFLSASSAHAGEPLKCDVMGKGDIEACKKRVKVECKQEEYWGRRSCEHALVQAMDGCWSTNFQKACAAATAVKAQICTRAELDLATDSFVDGWVKAISPSKAGLPKIKQFTEEWSGCLTNDFELATRDFRDKENGCRLDGRTYERCADDVAHNTKQLPEQVDQLLGSGVPKRPEALPKTVTPNDLEVANAKVDAIERLGSTSAKLVGVMARIPQDLRYKEAELKAALKALVPRAEELSAHRDKLDKQYISQLSCPKGKPLAANYKKVIIDFLDDNRGKRQVIRQTGDLYRSLDGGITREQIPVAACAEYTEKDGKHCRLADLSLNREKAPGSPWTSWRVAVGLGGEFNCAKFN